MSLRKNGERNGSEDMDKTESKFTKGTIPISDTRWKVFTVRNNEIVEIGEVFVSGKRVSKEMNDHQSIKGYEPYDIAERLTSKKFPKANPLIIEMIYAEHRRKIEDNSSYKKNR